MQKYEKKLKQYITNNKIEAKQYTFNKICHTVQEAAETANASPEDFVKSIGMISCDGDLIIAIVKGEDRASISKVAKALHIEKPRLATPEEILEKTGYLCGGVPSIGYEARFLIDPKVMEKDSVYSGGGSPYSLLKISTIALQQINNGAIVRVRK